MIHVYKYVLFKTYTIFSKVQLLVDSYVHVSFLLNKEGKIKGAPDDLVLRF